MLSLAPSAGMPEAAPSMSTVLSLSGPEGGLSENEERRAMEAGFTRVSLGPRVLRADTAPLALLAALNMQPPRDLDPVPAGTDRATR